QWRLGISGLPRGRRDHPYPRRRRRLRPAAARPAAGAEGSPRLNPSTQETMAEPLKTLAWDDFRLVRAVAIAQGLPGAAAALGVNHSTVFRRLGQIEKALGRKL